MQRTFPSILSTLLLATLSCFISLSARGQVTPDGTTSTTVNGDGNNFAIEQGDRVGDNLFHSFDEFSVPTLGSAVFNNAGDIANIFSRVTGGSISSIDGVLGANGAANLFLINPNGIIFGQNAFLNLGGSFFASTADSLLFEGDAEFSASNPQAAPLLEVNIPIGLSFRDNPGDIANLPGSILSVNSEKTLALIGGNISFDGAGVFGSSLELGSTLELGGITEAGIVAITEDGFLDFPQEVTRGDISLTNNSNLSAISRGGGKILINAKNLSLDTNSAISNGVLLDLDSVDVRSGAIIIDATEDVVIDGTDSNPGSAIINNVIDTTNEAGSRFGTAGNIEISANNISLIDGGFIASNITNFSQNSDRVNRNSNIILNARENILIEGSNGILPSSLANTISFGNGDSGDIEIASQNLFVREGAAISSSILRDGEGNAGNVNLEIDNLIVNSGSQINAATFGLGNAGNINITANTIAIDGGGETIFLDNNPSTISSSTSLDPEAILTENLAQSDAGDINISTNSLSITNGARLEAASESFGDAGDIKIEARDNILLDGGAEQTSSFIQNNTGSFFNNSGRGNAGNIEINTSRLRIFNNSFLSSATFNQGNAGNITINASEVVEVSKEGFVGNDVLASATGSSGSLTIDTGNLIITEGGQISVTTRGEGNAGNLTVRAADSVEISGVGNLGSRSGLFAGAFDSIGNSGELNIFTQDLTISDRGVVNVGNFPSSENSISNPGIGESGNLTIQAVTIDLRNGAEITAATQSPIGEGANITFVSDSITLRDNSTISARAFADANGGNLSIDADDGFILAFPNQNNDIIANAAQGRGGNINIDTQAIFGLEERPLNPITNDINASSEATGLDGTIDINNPAVDPTTGLINLPASVGDASDQISQNPCQQGVGSQFVVTGKGGLPPNPTETLNSESAEVGLIEAIPRERQSVLKDTPSNDWEMGRQENASTTSIPAQGWVFNDEGEVTLTAYKTTDEEIQRSSPKISNSCSTRVDK